MSHDMPKPWKFPSLDSCQKRFLWIHKEVDLALPHPVIGLMVPMGSPSRVGDVAVYVFEPSLPTPFYYVLVPVSSLWPFQLYFIPSILQTTLRALYSVLPVLFLPYWSFQLDISL